MEEREALTMGAFRFGVVPWHDWAWPEYLDHARRLEAMGVDSLWVPDHFVYYRRATQPLFEAWTTLAALAMATSRVRLGPLVLNITYYNPAVVAKMAAHLDVIAGGRLELGIGAAGGPLDHAMTGVPPWSGRERVARLGEFVALVDGLLRGEVVTSDGPYYPVTESRLVSPAMQAPRLPLTVAAHGPKSLRLAARFADCWNSLGATGTDLGTWAGVAPAEAFALTRRRSQQLDEACAEIGRDPATLRRSLLAGFTGDRPWASVDAFTDFVGRYRELGIEEFVFVYPPERLYRPEDAPPGIFERVVHDVLPSLRRAS